MSTETTQRYMRAKKIVSAVLELPRDYGDSYIAQQCADDEALKREVEWLLSAADAAEPTDIPLGWVHLHQAAPYVAEGAKVAAAEAVSYRVLRRIGEGGMGVVYLAERADGDVTRRVALKFINAGAASQAILKRFQAERRILAGLDHPNITHLVDAGTTTEGRPFIALEYVDGQPIDEWCNARGLDIRHRIELFLKVCSAVAYAHRGLVIHRDLKPGNVLVGPDGEPKLLDFGIARLLDSTDPARTETGQRAFTVAYASPEQIEGGVLTTAVDVWGLGVVLYRLLSGTMPFDSENTHQLSKAIVSGEVTPPSRQVLRSPEEATAGGPSRPEPSTGKMRKTVRRRARGIPKDLDAIILKALRRDPKQRYESVEDLGEDLRRFLKSRPVLARRGQRLYRARRYARRHWFGLIVTVAIAAMITAGALMREQQLRRVEVERDKAEALADFMDGLFKSADPLNTAGTEVTARTLLQRGAEKLQNRSGLDPTVKSAMLLSVGSAYLGLDASKDAIPLLQQARELLPDSAPVADRIATAEALGDAYSVNGDYRKAIDEHSEALRLLKVTPGSHRHDLIAEQIDLAADHEMLGDVPSDQAIATLTMLRNQLRPALADDAMLQDFVDNKIASAYTQAGNAQAALTVMREAVKQAGGNFGALDPRTLHDRWQLARALVADHPKEAIEVLQALLPDYAKVESTKSKTWALMLNDLSVAQSNAGNNVAAIESLRKARTAALAAGGDYDNYYLILSGNLASMLVEGDQNTEAEAVIQQTLPALKAQADEGAIHRAALAHALSALASSQWARKRYAEAGQNYFAAETALGNDAQNYYTVYRAVLEGEAKTATQMHHFPDAEIALGKLQKALADAQRPRNSKDALRLHLLQARLAIAKKDYKGAAALAELGLMAAQSAFDPCQTQMVELTELRYVALQKLGKSTTISKVAECFKQRAEAH